MAENNWWSPGDVVPLKKRLLWWFGIYFGLQLPLILLWPFIVDYPWGISPYVAFAFGYADPMMFRGIGYLFYFTHFLLIMAIPQRKVFLCLIFILVVVASLNTASCARIAGPAWYKGIPNIQG